MVRFIPFVVLTVACGGNAKDTLTRPTDPAGFSWEAPAPEWWEAGDASCPENGKLEATKKASLLFRQCMRGDTPHGPRGAWHENGTLVTEGLLRDGEPTGRWREWQPSGTLAAVAHFDDGVLEGKTIQYLSGGARAEESYKDGKRNGVSKFFDGGDRLIREVHYKEGEPHGKQTEYYPSGKPRTVTSHREGVVHGTVTRYAPNGETIGSLEIDAGNGPWTEWHDNGNVATQTSLRDGKQHGKYVRFHPGGKKAIVGEYNAGKEVGEWRAWDKGGGLLAVNSYDGGVPVRADTYSDGKLKRREEFHSNGGRKSRTDFSGKRREGSRVTWKKDGYREVQGAYKANRKTGNWYAFDDSNTPTLEVYKNGKRVGRKKKVSVADKPPAVEGLETGVERCDRFLRAYLSCAGIPANVRQDFTKNFQAWSEQLESATGEDANKLELACSEAAPTWSQGLATAGCAR